VAANQAILRRPRKVAKIINQPQQRLLSSTAQPKNSITERERESPHYLFRSFLPSTSLFMSRSLAHLHELGPHAYFGDCSKNKTLMALPKVEKINCTRKKENDSSYVFLPLIYARKT